MAVKALVSTRKGLFFYKRSGERWEMQSTHFAGTPVTLSFREPQSGAVYAALRHGHFGPKLHRSDDGGASWIEIATPAFPADAGGNPTLKQVWALTAASDGTLWAGAIPAGVFTSRDTGASWQFGQSLWDGPDRGRWSGGGYDESGMHSIVCDPRDASHVLVGISSGGVWETHDAGKSWQVRTNGMYAAYAPPEQKYDPAIQDPHRMVHCPAEPDVMWIQHHNGVFRSADGGGAWEELHPPVSSFGFAAAAHPSRTETAWFVPAHSDQRREPVDGRVVVNRTDDGGKTFTTLSHGLPGEQAYDLVYRHGLVVDESGERLAMGSTTGGLWFSGDGGESWTMSAARLPPIYAVDFA